MLAEQIRDLAKRMVRLVPGRCVTRIYYPKTGIVEDYRIEIANGNRVWYFKLNTWYGDDPVISEIECTMTREDWELKYFFNEMIY